jgi:hypothetical protein
MRILDEIISKIKFRHTAVRSAIFFSFFIATFFGIITIQEEVHRNLISMIIIFFIGGIVIRILQLIFSEMEGDLGVVFTCLIFVILCAVPFLHLFFPTSLSLIVLYGLMGYFISAGMTEFWFAMKSKT